MSVATLTSKGQITVPKAIREYLNIDTGDQVEFIIAGEGKVIMCAKTIEVDELCGMVERKQGVSISDMKQGIKDKITGRHNQDASHRHKRPGKNRR